MNKVIFKCEKCGHPKGEVITWDRETVIECENCKAWETISYETQSE